MGGGGRHILFTLPSLGWLLLAVSGQNHSLSTPSVRRGGGLDSHQFTSLKECEDACVHGECDKDLWEDDKWICLCYDGWRGYECDKKVNGWDDGWDSHQVTPPTECKKSSCVNGQCLREGDNLICFCDDGWGGYECDQRVFVWDDTETIHQPTTSAGLCASNPCQFGGSCHVQNPSMGYVCACADYRTGKNCESTCEYPAWGKNCEKKCIGCTSKACFPTHGCVACDVPGWTGVPNCDRADCKEVPCENFGFCQKSLRGHKMKCICTRGYTGKRCEEKQTKIPEFTKCHEEKMKEKKKQQAHCWNGATCVSSRVVLTSENWALPWYKMYNKDLWYYMCVCPKGYFGFYCNYQCLSPHTKDCDNGDCVPHKFLRDKATCKCWAGFHGKKCIKTCDSGKWGKGCLQKCGACASDEESCHHVHGLCPNNECKKGHYGVRCEKNMDVSRSLRSLVKQKMSMTMYSVQDFNVKKVADSDKDMNPATKELINALQIFIRDSYDKHNKTVLDLSNVILREVPLEIIDVKGKKSRKEGGFVSRKRRQEPTYFEGIFGNNRGQMSRFRRSSTQNPNGYEFNYTLSFPGDLKDIKSKEIQSILRKEAGNFKYPGVTIVRNSIKTAGKKQVELTGASSQDGRELDVLKIVGPVVVAVILVLVVAVFLRQVIRRPKSTGQGRTNALPRPGTIRATVQAFNHSYRYQGRI